MRHIIAILMLILSPALFAVDKYPVEHFFKDSAMSQPALSPDGQYLAALTPLNVNRETVSRCKNKTTKRKSRSGTVDFCDVSRRNIVVFKLSDPDPDCQNGIIAKCERIRVTQLRSQNVSGFMWVNNDRIMFQTGGDQLNGVTGAIDSIGIYAVNKDSTQAKQLVKPSDALTNTKVIQTIPLSTIAF